MPNDPDRGAAFARALAGARTHADAARVIAEWRHALGGRAPRAPAAAAAGRMTAPPAIGIWRPALVGGETWYVRDPGAFDRQAWADVERIGPKRGRRVVLFGESCARGWPLDPLISAAGLLYGALAKAGGADVEVIDLAKLACSAPELLGLIDAAAALDPDACIVFAGNNWRVPADAIDPEALAANVREGWPRVAGMFAAAAHAQLRVWTSAVADGLRRAGRPALFIIPAENIVDFPVAPTLRDPLMTAAETLEREALIAAIAALQREQRWAESAPIAETLIALERRLGIWGLQARARAALALGEHETAEALFAEARELLVAFPVLGLSSFRARTDILRDGMAAAGIPAVDVPRLLRAAGGGAPPGREWFYDDCHMTEAGLRLAMDAAAGMILPRLPAAPRTGAARETPAAAPRPEIERRAEAQAACIAALVNTHDERATRDYLARAVALMPELADVLSDYLELRLRRGALWLCPAYHRIRAWQARLPGLSALERSDAGAGREHAHRDLIVARAIGDLLAARAPALGARADAWLRRKYAPGRSGGVDLLHQAAIGESELLGQQPARLPRAFLRCWRPTLAFTLIGAAPGGWRVRMTARLPRPSRDAPVARAAIGGAVIAHWTLGAAWTTVEACFRRPGVPATQHSSRQTAAPRRASGDADVLTITWPSPAESEPRWAQAARAFEAGPAWVFRTEELYPAWAEVHALECHALDDPLPHDTPSSHGRADTDSGLTRHRQEVSHDRR